MKKFSMLAVLFFITVVSNAQSVTTLHINPDDAMGGTTSQIFDSVHFIPLETTKESLFGRIYQLEVTDKHFIILDIETKAILFFDRNGKFECKIKPKAPDSFLSYFTVDRKNKRLIVKTAVNAICIYNFNGKFLYRKTLPFYANAIYGFENGNMAYIRPGWPDEKDSTNYSIVFSKGYNHIFKSALPYNVKYAKIELNEFVNVVNSSGEPESAMLSFPGNYNVYQFNDTGVTHHYKFVFPRKYSLPPNFATDSAYAGKRAKYIYYTPENNGKFETIQNIYKLDDYLLFTTWYEGYFTKDRSYAYNLKTGNLVSFGRVSGDSSSFFMPLLFPSFGEKMEAVYNRHIYTSFPSFILFYIKEHTDKKNTYNTVLDNFFKNEDRKSNLVIIESKLKY